MNLLVNGDFTDGQHVWQSNPTVQIPNSWDLFAYDQAGHMPECYCMMMGPPQNIGPIWKVFTSYAQHEHALGERVIVPVGAELVFRASVWAWSSGQDDPMRSLNGGSYHTRIGIDPFGGMEWRSPHIVWDYPPLGHKVMDTRDEHSVAAVAEAGVVTVWLSGRHEWALKHGDAYWFQASLESLYTPEPPPTGDLAERVGHLEDDVDALSAAAYSFETRIQRIEDFLTSFRKE